MRILVFSDTHHNINNCVRAIDLIKDIDMILHAGDCNCDAEELQMLYPDIPVMFVQGNNDFSNKPWDLLIEVEDKKIFLTHGHAYSVKYEQNYSTLVKKAREEQADLVVFGHTHVPYCDVNGDLQILNPGSIKYGRTYGVVEIENGKLRSCILNI